MGKETDPRQCEEACLRGKFHSVLGDRRKCRGTFREFVVFDEDQVYANYILAYTRVDPPPEKRSARKLQITVPAGVSANTTIQVSAPDGTAIQVLVPPGVSA